jgi:SAM-dependent methyltransferase
VLWEQSGHKIVRCGGCTMMFADPREEGAGGYDESYYRDGHHVDDPHRRALFEERYREVISTLEPPGKILDVGCGTGDFLLVCSEHGWETVGVDISSYAARITRERTRGEAHGGPLADAPLVPASFDVVHMHHMLEHVADPVSTLKSVRELLRPGGRLVIEVPNERNLINLAMRLQRKPMLPSDQPPTHLLFFDPTSLPETVEAAGFVVDAVRQKDLTSAARRHIYRYFDGQGNALSRTVEKLYRLGIPSRLGLGVFLILQAHRPSSERAR